MNEGDELPGGGTGDATGCTPATFAIPEGPDLDLAPEAFTALGARLLAALADYKRALPGRPVRPLPPVELTREIFAQELPETGAEPGDLLDWMTDNLLPSSFGNDHPGFFAWITAPSAPIGALAELMAATVNTPAGGPAPAAVNLEACVTRWLMELCGFPVEGSHGILVSGGSMANLTALAVARHWAAKADGWNIRTEGLQGEVAHGIHHQDTACSGDIRCKGHQGGFPVHILRQIVVFGSIKIAINQ